MLVIKKVLTLIYNMKSFKKKFINFYYKNLSLFKSIIKKLE